MVEEKIDMTIGVSTSSRDGASFPRVKAPTFRKAKKRPTLGRIDDLP